MGNNISYRHTRLEKIDENFKPLAAFFPPPKTLWLETSTDYIGLSSFTFYKYA